MKNKYIKISVFVLLLFLVVILIANFIISNIVENKVTEFLLKKNSKYYTSTVKNVNFNLLDRSITIKDFQLNPTDLSLSEIKQHDTVSKNLIKIFLSSFELNGIHLQKAIFDKNIEINELDINELFIQKIKNINSKKIPSHEKSINLDSIFIKNINGFKINKIGVNNISYKIIDIVSNDTIFQHKPISFYIDGFKLYNIGNQFFKIKPIKEIFEINDIKINLQKKKFTLDIKAINLNFDKKIIAINNIKYKPIMPLKEMSKTNKFNDAVIGLGIQDLTVYNFDFRKTVRDNSIFIDSILVSGMNLDIFKDKSKPWNTNKIKKLPHIALKQLDFPLYIQKVKIEKSTLKLEEDLGKKDLFLHLTIDAINAQITNITSIKDFRENPMKVRLSSKLMNKAALYANITFPLKDNQSVFYFNGSLSASKFIYFDSAIFPVLGLKILKGNLQSLKFSAKADNFSSSGKMTMLYDNLEAKIFKANSTEKSKTLSWAVNKVIHNANPKNKKNPKVRVVEMHYNRVPYQGFGGYLWKTLQSGIVNTIAPGGKTIGKVQGKKDKKNRNPKKK